MQERSDDLAQFFINYPLEQGKKNLWKLFSGWTYHTCESGDAEAISSMLMFYEQLVELMENMEKLAINSSPSDNL